MRLDASLRRRWSAEAKARLVEESLNPGANASATARQAGLASSVAVRLAAQGGREQCGQEGYGWARLCRGHADSICVGRDRAGWRSHSRGADIRRGFSGWHKRCRAICENILAAMGDTSESLQQAG